MPLTVGVALSGWLLLGLQLAVLQGATINLNWTIAGVQNYTDYPLMVMIGDSINFMCDPDIISNFIYVETEEQYTSCNSTATEGCTIMSGDCLAGFSPADMFSQSIQRFSGSSHCSVVEYRPKRLYYFYSSSTGELSTATDGPPFIGGQCNDGLKMKVFVLDVPTSTVVSSSTSQPGVSPSPKIPNKPGGTGNSDEVILSPRVLAGIIFGIVVIIIVIGCVVLFVFCFVYFGHKSNSIDLGESGSKNETISSSEEAVALKDNCAYYSKGAVPNHEPTPTMIESDQSLKESDRPREPEKKAGTKRNGPANTNSGPAKGATRSGDRVTGRGGGGRGQTTKKPMTPGAKAHPKPSQIAPNNKRTDSQTRTSATRQPASRIGSRNQTDSQTRTSAPASRSDNRSQTTNTKTNTASSSSSSQPGRTGSRKPAPTSPPSRTSSSTASSTTSPTRSPNTGGQQPVNPKPKSSGRTQPNKKPNIGNFQYY